MVRGPGTVAWLVTESGTRYVVEQRTYTRNRYGARASEATLYHVGETGRSTVAELESSLSDTEVALEDAVEKVEQITGETVSIMDD